MRLLLLESTCTHMQPLLLELVASGCPCWCWPAPAPLWTSGALPLQGGWLLMLLPPQGRNFHCPHVDQLCFHQSLKHLHSNSCQRAKCFFYPIGIFHFFIWVLLKKDLIIDYWLYFVPGPSPNIDLMWWSLDIFANLVGSKEYQYWHDNVDHVYNVDDIVKTI